MMRDLEQGTEHLRERLREVALQLDAEVYTAKALIDVLAGEVDGAVKSDRQRRAILTQLGMFHSTTDVREVLTKYLYMRLGALRPYIPFVGDPGLGTGDDTTCPDTPRTEEPT
jgi:hypothetical protein